MLKISTISISTLLFLKKLNKKYLKSLYNKNRGVEMLDSVVQIESQDKNNNSFGTGFVIDRDSNGVYILTCQHVIEDVEMPAVNSLPAEIVVQGNFIDMAVIYVPSLQLKPLTLQIDKCESREVDVIGFSRFDEDVSQKKHIIATLFKNVIELHYNKDDSFYLARRIKAKDNYNFDRGNSGSPVICQKTGCVIAMVSNKEGSSIAYAIEISSIKEVWKELKSICNSDSKHIEFYNNLDSLREKLDSLREKIDIAKRKKLKKSPIRYYLAGILTVIVAYIIYIQYICNGDIESSGKNYFRVEANNLFFQLNYPASFKKNEKIIITAILENRGKEGDIGGITLSFPQRPLLDYSVDYNNFDKLNFYEIGDKIYNNRKNSSSKVMKAIHPTLEAISYNWKKGVIHSFAITITPPEYIKNFQIRARAFLTLNRVIPTDGVFDQQHFKSKEITIPCVD